MNGADFPRPAGTLNETCKSVRVRSTLLLRLRIQLYCLQILDAIVRRFAPLLPSRVRHRVALWLVGKLTLVSCLLIYFESFPESASEPPRTFEVPPRSY